MERELLATALGGRLPAGEAPGATIMTDEIAERWGLGGWLKEAVEEIAKAAPIAADRRGAYVQARSLKRAWRCLLRAQTEARCGVLPPTCRARSEVAASLPSYAPDALSDELGLTAGLRRALAAIHAASRMESPDDVSAQLAEAMAALTLAIHVREAVAFPIQDDVGGGP